MANSTEMNRPYWEDTVTQMPAAYPLLEDDLDADVVVVGAGIVGLTAALALSRAGKSVVVLEALRIGSQVTARSTAKITSQHGMIYARLIRDFGEEKARLYARANQRAIDAIEATVAQASIECAFERLPAYAYTESEQGVRQIEDEARAAARLGLPAHLDDDIPAPVRVARALRFDGQAQFNPVRYLHGLASYLAQRIQIFEMSRVVTVEKWGAPAADSHGKTRRMRIETSAKCTVSADHVVVATHLPTVPDGMLFAKAYPFGHSMAAAPLKGAHALGGMCISTGTPGFSFRMDSSLDRPYLIAVGPTFKNGVPEEQESSFQQLEKFMRDAFAITAPTHRWTNMDFRSMDGVPFIGRASASAERVYVATGFNAWGITTGTMAGQVIADQILGRPNDYIELFDASRVKPWAGGKEFLKENAIAAKHFVADRFHGRDVALSEIQPGEGAVLKLDGDQVAAYRDESGRLHSVSAVCTHLACIVGWNTVDRTWDCPCHGSRFHYDGSVIHGPATKPLKSCGPRPSPQSGDDGNSDAQGAP